MKTITDEQLNGELGETLVKAKVHQLGHVFEGRGRLESGIDGTIELRDPATGRMLGKTIAVQVKTRREGSYTRETEASFEYLLRPSDLAYWRGSNLPVVIVLLRLSDESFYWKSVDAGVVGEERRLLFDKTSDRFDAGSMDRLAQIAVERGRLGSFVPPMRIGEESVEMTLVADAYDFAASLILLGDAPGRPFLDEDEDARLLPVDRRIR